MNGINEWNGCIYSCTLTRGVPFHIICPLSQLQYNMERDTIVISFFSFFKQPIRGWITISFKSRLRLKQTPEPHIESLRHCDTRVRSNNWVESEFKWTHIKHHFHIHIYSILCSQKQTISVECTAVQLSLVLFIHGDSLVKGWSCRCCKCFFCFCRRISFTTHGLRRTRRRECNNACVSSKQRLYFLFSSSSLHCTWGEKVDACNNLFIDFFLFYFSNICECERH